jgi:hypothetical protein
MYPDGPYYYPHWMRKYDRQEHIFIRVHFLVASENRAPGPGERCSGSGEAGNGHRGFDSRVTRPIF